MVSVGGERVRQTEVGRIAFVCLDVTKNMQLVVTHEKTFVNAEY